MDMVFPTCEFISPSTGIGSNCKINIAYNQQKPLCASTSPAVSQKNCRMPDQLCSADPGFKFDFTPGSPVRCALFLSAYTSSDRCSQWFTSLDISSLSADATNSLLLFDTSFSPSLPVPLRIGDIDLDGFPDLVPIVVHKDGSRTPRVLVSHPCSPGVKGCSSSFGRTFGIQTKNTGALDKITDARGISFLDIDEDVSKQFTFQLACVPLDPEYCDRGHGISWCNGRENNLDNASVSSRTTSSMTRSSSKR